MQPTSALDALVSQGNNVLVDIRSAKDKEEAGVPDLADPSECWAGWMGWDGVCGEGSAATCW